MLFNFRLYTKPEHEAPDSLLIYKGMQITVRLAHYLSYSDVQITLLDKNHKLNIKCEKSRALDLIEDIEQALVYDKSRNPEMFL